MVSVVTAILCISYLQYVHWRIQRDVATSPFAGK